MPYPAPGRNPAPGRYPGRKAQILVPTGTLPRTVRYRRGRAGMLRTRVFADRTPYMTDDLGEAQVLKESFGFRQLTGLEEAIIAKNPELYWPLDSVDGATDLTGNGHDGTGGGGISIGGFAFGTSTDFDGTDDRITSGWSPYVNGTSRTFIGQAWRDTSTTADTVFASGAAAATDSVNMFLGSATQNVVWRAGGSDEDSDTWTAAWPGDGQWVFWALVFSEATDTASLYINGSLVSALTHTADYDAGVGTFQLGANTSSFTTPFDGKMKHVAIYMRALSAADIATLADLV